MATPLVIPVYDEDENEYNDYNSYVTAAGSLVLLRPYQGIDVVASFINAVSAFDSIKRPDDADEEAIDLLTERLEDAISSSTSLEGEKVVSLADDIQAGLPDLSVQPTKLRRRRSAVAFLEDQPIGDKDERQALTDEVVLLLEDSLRSCDLLALAASLLDRPKWKGTKVDSDQPLAWPRDSVGATKEAAPKEIQQAQALLAAYLFNDLPRWSGFVTVSAEDAIKDIKISDFEIELQDQDVVSASDSSLPRVVEIVIADLVESVSGKPQKRVWRA